MPRFKASGYKPPVVREQSEVRVNMGLVTYGTRSLKAPNPYLLLKYLGVDVDADDASNRWRLVSSKVLSVLMSQPNMEGIDAFLTCGILADQIVMRQIALEHLRRWGFFDLENSKQMTERQRVTTIQVLKVMTELDKAIRAGMDRAMLTPLARKRLDILTASTGGHDMATAADAAVRARQENGEGRKHVDPGN